MGITIAFVVFLFGFWAGGGTVLWKYSTLGVAHPREIEKAQVEERRLP